MSRTTERKREQTAISRHSGPLKQDAIDKLLMTLAEARQAPISTETLLLFSSRLVHFDIEHVRVAVEKLMLTPREAGETAFPDLATLEQCIWDVKNTRLRLAREQREREEAEAEARDRREHPENYFSVGEMIAEFLKTHSIEASAPDRKFVPSPQIMLALLEIFSEQDFLAMAAVRKQQDAMKAKAEKA